jgi:GT2 family glycosyltransferase
MDEDFMPGRTIDWVDLEKDAWMQVRPRASLSRPRATASEAGVVDVSVCIVNWNGCEMLRACLTSLLSQPQGAKLEIVVVDNASQDGAPDMVAREFPDVTLVRNAHNLGFSRANNQAAALAHGRYLFFLNNDTVIPPGVVGRLLAYAEAHPRVGMIGPRLRGTDGRIQASYRPRPTLAALLHRTLLLRATGLFRRMYKQYRREQFDPHRPRRVETLMGAALFLPRLVFEQCGPWDEDFTFGGEDLRFSDCIAQCYSLIFLPSVEITHHGGVSTRLHIGYAWSARAAGYAQYLRKSGYCRSALLLYKLLITLDVPLQVALLGMHYLVRRLRGQPARAKKSLLAWHGAFYFLTRGLIPFWKA